MSARLATPAAALLALAQFGPAASFAQQPPLQPTRDVVAIYRVEGEATRLVPGGLDAPVRLSWSAARRQLRAEADGRAQVALLDLATNTGQVIDTRLRVVLPIQVRADQLRPLTLAGARLSPRGRAMVAGLSCTEYRIEGGKTPGSVCLTGDGVPLRGQGEIQGRPGRFTALSVRYEALPRDLFEPPPGYIMLGDAGLLGSLPGSLPGSLKDLANGLGLGRTAP